MHVANRQFLSSHQANYLHSIPFPAFVSCLGHPRLMVMENITKSTLQPNKAEFFIPPLSDNFVCDLGCVKRKIDANSTRS